jgi:hypothetical protein
MRTPLAHLLLFVPIALLVMTVYVASQAEDASGVLRLAARKTVKLVAWTVVIVLAMWLLQAVFLP